MAVRMVHRPVHFLACVFMLLECGMARTAGRSGVVPGRVW